jgi:ribonuclease P protein component
LQGSIKRVFFFSKSDRLLKRCEFLRLSRTGKRVQNRFFVGIFLPGKTDKCRLGITVTKKVGCAVTRNRLKRLVREYFRTRKSTIKGTWDINIIARKAAAESPSEKLFPALQRIFDEISNNERD